MHQPAFDFSRFTSDIEAAAADLLGDAPCLERRIAAVRRVQEAAEQALANAPDSHLLEIACGPGCGHCCIVNVAVLEPEVEIIIDYLPRHLSSEEFAYLRQRVEVLHHKVVGLDDEERLFLREPCVFLDRNKRCSIHPVRPLLCRSLTSTSPQTCSEAIALLALGEAPTILCNIFQSSLFEHAFIGLGRALKRQGLNSKSRTLTCTLRERLR